MDTGFVMARSLELSANSGRQLENMVFVELLRRGFDIRKNELFYYHTASGKEIDFVTKKGTTVDTLIQVAYEIAKPKTRNRELDALAVASEELKCSNLLLVTWDTDEQINYKGKDIQIISARNWFLSNGSEAYLNSAGASSSVHGRIRKRLVYVEGYFAHMSVFCSCYIKNHGSRAALTFWHFS